MHVLDKSGFAAPGRSLQHDGQALGEGGSNTAISSPTG